MTKMPINLPPTSTEVAELCRATEPEETMHNIARRLAFDWEKLKRELKQSKETIRILRQGPQWERFKREVGISVDELLTDRNKTNFRKGEDETN